MATLAFPTKSPLNWCCARWSEGPLFGHWRSGVTFAQVSCRSTRRGVVREHPAPSGALRRPRPPRYPPHRGPVREHPAPSGALRRLSLSTRRASCWSQGAPSTIRCIKTLSHEIQQRQQQQRQGAPSTIRCIKTTHAARSKVAGSGVREHPAPSGALRLLCESASQFHFIHRQGAPSTIRCIKTSIVTRLRERRMSGSTQHHQVH